MGYIEKNLIPGEQIIFKTRLHPIAILPQVFLGVLVGLAGLFCFYQSATHRNEVAGQSRTWAICGGILIFMGLLAVILAFAKRNATEMAVTNRRVIIKTGIASRRTIELLLSNVESIVITEPFLGRMLGYGTIIVRGTGGTPEPFDRIANPTEFRRCVEVQAEAVRQKQ